MPEPRIFISEAVLLYLPSEQVRIAIANLADRFDGSLIALDTGGEAMMRKQDRSGVMKAMTARMQWVCENPDTLRTWGLELIESRTFARPQARVAQSWPWRFRYGNRMMTAVAPGFVNTSKLNLFCLRLR
ncbi:hypothetical protein QWI29_07705 [Mycolicibacterium neoaurum]|uniref:hypothetical protein n=1 Tax=Mycolicibacterium neoaurum TaxID=1795 RepID=UPI002671A202|nr:hypothetical protein [Mycolicibacterium neoaurum]MDO3399910.1 hypothetical protein [Mycolicibacterium neoaurum]